MNNQSKIYMKIIQYLTLPRDHELVAEDQFPENQNNKKLLAIVS